MAKQCEFTDRKMAYGNQKTYRGKAKYLGGVGKKITGISRRVYKEGMPHDKAVQIIAASKGSHFDPDIADAFLDLQDEFQAIAGRFADSEVVGLADPVAGELLAHGQNGSLPSSV